MSKEDVLHDPEFVRHLQRVRTSLRLARALMKQRWNWSEDDRKRFEDYLTCRFSISTDELIMGLELLVEGEYEDAFELLKAGQIERLSLKALVEKDGEAELEFAISTFRKDSLTEELLELLNVELWECHKLQEYKRFLSILNRAERAELFSRIHHLHPYVQRAIFEKPVSPIVIDGSNVLYEHTGFVNVDRLVEVFDFLAALKGLLYPYRIVFDKNIRYVVPFQQREKLGKWLSSSWVEEYSPADERIIELARRLKAVVLSNDSFSEYDTRGLKFLRFGGRRK